MRGEKVAIFCRLTQKFYLAGNDTIMQKLTKKKRGKYALYGSAAS